MTTTLPTDVVTDPHGLLASAEELATEPELARMLGVSRAVLRELLHGPLYNRVRFVRYTKAPWRFCVSDARTAIEPHRPAIEQRRRKADEQEAAEQAAAAARRAASAATPRPAAPRKPEPPPTAMRPAATLKRETSRPSSRQAPEVFVRRTPRA
jgi:hypothetical protein